MRFGIVKANITSTVKNKELLNEKLFVVEYTGPDKKSTGIEVVAIDRVNAGIGDFVIVADEGGSARIILGKKKAPVRVIIVGVIDNVDYKE